MRRERGREGGGGGGGAVGMCIFRAPIEMLNDVDANNDMLANVFTLLAFQKPEQQTKDLHRGLIHHPGIGPGDFLIQVLHTPCARCLCCESCYKGLPNIGGRTNEITLAR